MQALTLNKKLFMFSEHVEDHREQVFHACALPHEHLSLTIRGDT